MEEAVNYIPDYVCCETAKFENRMEKAMKNTKKSTLKNT